jgi:hypothetical protein
VACLERKRASRDSDVGVQSSGIGVEFGEEGLAAYTTIKIINGAA